jgi:hypothetical protein
LEQFTNGCRQFGPGEIGELACDPADRREFRFGQSMTAERQTLTDCDWHRKQPARCRPPRSSYWNPWRKFSEIFPGKLENVQTPDAAKPRHSSASVLKGKVLEQAQQLWDEGRSVPDVAAELEVLTNTLHKAIRAGRLRGFPKKASGQQRK